MTPNPDYFARYEAIAAMSGRMLSAARRAHWSDLEQLQDEFRVLIERLDGVEAGVTLDDAGRARKYGLIRQILADDAAIRDLLNPGMARLSALFSGRSTHALKSFYGAH
ncbi:flagellar protein FliT [Paraburkholderia bonniea]|uniref:flagellar protein FliT n=1 Tax=Paraburkholderia bonniea TaxID=2152891 RepID=UPI001290A3FA|nr:flagellar protein FliT [Paraburkholderia bonniea]WJF90475.1 flagellar protein FliT [Paraburkholderia bonniea]WJF93790.1 flagellar protein FliT [Paraburkholderia bonniea]